MVNVQAENAFSEAVRDACSEQQRIDPWVSTAESKKNNCVPEKRNHFLQIRPSWMSPVQENSHIPLEYRCPARRSGQIYACVSAPSSLIETSGDSLGFE